MVINQRMQLPYLMSSQIVLKVVAISVSLQTLANDYNITMKTLQDSYYAYL